MGIGVLYVTITVISWGASTAFLKLAITEGDVDASRLIRAISQTILVIVAFWVFTSSSQQSLKFGMLFPLLSGLLSGFAFIFFSHGLEIIPASTAKPLLSLKLVISVTLGILVLNETFTLFKVLGVSFALSAIFLLSTEEEKPSSAK